MKIYHYSEKTGEYLGESVAALDPVEKKPLIPARATTEAQPAAGENKAAVWANDAWQIVDDFRGFVGYDANGEKHEIKELNQKPDPKWTAEPPAPEPVIIKQFSARQFLKRLTREERLAIKNSTDNDVLLWYDELIAADFVDVEDPDTIAGANYGLSVGIFADESRVAEILATETAGL